MFLMIKVNVPIDLKLFKGTLKPLQAHRIKKNFGGGLPVYEKYRPLWKIVSWNCLQWLEILFTFIGVGDASFHYKFFPLQIIFFKGATKLYFMYYSRVVIILFRTSFYKSAFSIYFLVKLGFCVSCFYIFGF